MSFWCYHFGAASFIVALFVISHFVASPFWSRPFQCKFHENNFLFPVFQLFLIKKIFPSFFHFFFKNN